MSEKTLRYRLGLDLGTNSLGWAMLELDDNNDPCRVIKLGVRIFDSGRKPKDGASKAVDRRSARQMRRRHDRYLHRRNQYLRSLVSCGLLPASETERQKLVSLNPWRLRSAAVETQLPLFEVGRALFHLQQRRGFKSNRRVDTSETNEKETTGLKGAIHEFAAHLENRTVGQELWKRIQNGEPARARKVGSGQSERYAFYVDRSMVAYEFDVIWQTQAKFDPSVFSEQARILLKDNLLFQRNLLPQTPGCCYFEPSELRMPMACETAQLFRLFQEVNNLRLKNESTLESRSLSKDERDQAIGHLSNVKDMQLASLRKKLLGKDFSNYRFTLETTNRPTLKGNQTSAILSKPEHFGSNWSTFTLNVRDEIAQLIAFESNERFLIDQLVSRFERSVDEAESISQMRLPDAFLRISQKAGQRILEQLINGWDVENDAPLTYDKAVVAAGYRSHSNQSTGEILEQLPYYGEILAQYTAPMPKSKVLEEARFGKIGNPTVHLGLNQVRKIVNAIIKRYGLPEQIVVEVGRDLKNGKYTRHEIEKEQKVNRERNEEFAKELEKIGLVNNAANRLRLGLYEELGALKKCVYSGKTISLAQLFTNEIQIDHILPMARTLDDSFKNKILAFQGANKFKGNLSPFEAFGSSPTGYNWDEIVTRAKVLPPNKVRRFSSDAVPVVDGFLARQMTDTQYLARVTNQYLKALVTVDVWSTPGQLTGMLRNKWGLNEFISINGEKNREDHRHHAIDAAVIAVTDRSLLKRMGKSSERAILKDLDKDFDDFPDPWDTFRSELAQKVARIVVSYKPEHGIAAALHNETAYGIERPGEAGEPSVVRHKISLLSIDEKHLGNLKAPNDDLSILDVDIRFLREIEDALLASNSTREQQQNLQALVDKSGRRSVTLRESMTVIPIFKRGEKGVPGTHPYKAYKGDGNHCYEIFESENDKWDGRIISKFEANSNEYVLFSKTNNFKYKTFNGEKLVMRLMTGDTLVFEDDPTIFRVQKISLGSIAVAPINEANVDARTRDKESGFNLLSISPGPMQRKNARRVFINELGQVHDPGIG